MYLLFVYFLVTALNAVASDPPVDGSSARRDAACHHALLALLGKGKESANDFETAVLYLKAEVKDLRQLGEDLMKERLEAVLERTVTGKDGPIQQRVVTMEASFKKRLTELLGLSKNLEKAADVEYRAAIKQFEEAAIPRLPQEANSLYEANEVQRAAKKLKACFEELALAHRKVAAALLLRRATAQAFEKVDQSLVDKFARDAVDRMWLGELERYHETAQTRLDAGRVAVGRIRERMQRAVQVAEREAEDSPEKKEAQERLAKARKHLAEVDAMLARPSPGKGLDAIIAASSSEAIDRDLFAIPKPPRPIDLERAPGEGPSLEEVVSNLQKQFGTRR